MVEAKDISFISEIRCMMYALGDCRSPSEESAQVIQDTVQHELGRLIDLSMDAPGDDKQPKQLLLRLERIVFQLRRNRILLMRLIRHMKLRDQKNQLNFKSAEETGDLVGMEDASITGQTEGSRVRLIDNMLSQWDVDDELKLLSSDQHPDHVKFERAKRAAQQAAACDQKEYFQYAKARQVSWCPPKQTQKFRDWLLGVGAAAIDISHPMVLETLNFLAYEITATLIDSALLIKRETSAHIFAHQQSRDSIVRLRTANIAAAAAAAGAAASATKSTASVAVAQHHQVALLLAQKLRERVQNSSEYASIGIDALQTQQIQPWQLREAVRRLQMRSNKLDSVIL